MRDNIYDRATQNIRDGVRGRAPGGGVSPAGAGRLGQVLERLRGAPAAQASPPDLVALLESAGGAAAVTSPRLAVPFHHALLQAQSGGRAAGPRARFPPPAAVPVGEKLGEVAHPGL